MKNQNTNTGVNNTMPNNNSSFGERFKNKGEIGELMFLSIHKQNAIALVDDKFSRKVDTDFLVINKPKDGIWNYKSKEQFVRCEVKQDNKCWDTGNLFLEYRTVRRGTGEKEYGWTITCRADELWYFDTKNKLFYVFDFPKLRVFLKNHFNELPEPRNPFYDSEDDADKYGKLYKIEEDRANALKMIVFIDDVDGLDEECDRYLKLFYDKADKKEIEEFIYHTAQFVDFLICLNGGEPQMYNKCVGDIATDNYIIAHRNTECVQKQVDTMRKVMIEKHGVRYLS